MFTESKFWMGFVVGMITTGLAFILLAGQLPELLGEYFATGHWVITPLMYSYMAMLILAAVVVGGCIWNLV